MGSRSSSDCSDEESSDSSLQSFLAELSSADALPSSRTSPSSLKAIEADIMSVEESLQSDELEVHSLQSLGRAENILGLPGHQPSLTVTTQRFESRAGHDIFSIDLPSRNNSDSPQTDPDFEESPVSSSPCTSTSWIAGTGMISSDMANSMISSDGNGERSIGDIRRDIFYDAEDRSDRARELDVGGDAALVDMFHAGDLQESEESETSESGEESECSGRDLGDDMDDISTNKISSEQAQIALAVTLVVMATLWAWECSCEVH
ncbi:uncharacterized protein LY89DRAFT_689771 [Mollisia scopiformis]|uniref:Uncharacterized protein n=1 Tax=Mollisia scopiformis TaxID=149040 RepID=A0A132BDT1_MOLSC|nr:uncharacterized protein LY89DRAFT_689771 [Mollisia scopiformis]KUJ10580.1 hypothetical protein LY89DRAFT_689771 [Mollisia scopiformis]